LGLPRNPASNWRQSSPTHPFEASGSTTKSKIQRELSKLGTEVAELADSISCHQEIESPSQKSSTFFFNFSFPPLQKAAALSVTINLSLLFSG